MEHLAILSMLKTERYGDNTHLKQFQLDIKKVDTTGQHEVDLLQSLLQRMLRHITQVQMDWNGPSTES